jgi:hypothetical protein
MRRHPPIARQSALRSLFRVILGSPARDRYVRSSLGSRRRLVAPARPQSAILAFVATSWWQDRVAAWLFVPYAAWAAYASMLNGSIWALN